MKKLQLILSLLLLAAPGLWGAETASALLGRTAAKIKAAKSLNVEYTLTANGQTMNGTLTLAGNSFLLVSPQVRSWYDGKTQWTYSTHIGEINITEPTSNELTQVNPFEIINSFSKNYNASFVKAPKGYSNIELKAKKKGADISNATVTVNDATGYPSAIKLVMNGGQSIGIKIKSVIPGGLLPASKFRFNPKEYPLIQVVDLR